MNENKVEKKELEINIQRLFSAVMKRAVWIGIVAVLLAVITCVCTIFFVAPKYKASAKFYVNNSDISLGGTSVSVSSGSITASRNLVESYIVLLMTRETLQAVAEYADVDLTYGQLAGMISASAVNETEIFQVTVTSKDPKQAEQIANAIAKLDVGRVSSMIDLDGWGFIVKKESETKAKQMSFSEAYDKIAENVQKAAAKKAYDEWIIRLKDTSFIKIYPMPKE